MTIDDVFAELAMLPLDDPEAACDLYRRAARAGVAWAGLAKRLARSQPDSLAMLERLAAIYREETAGG